MTPPLQLRKNRRGDSKLHPRNPFKFTMQLSLLPVFASPDKTPDSAGPSDHRPPPVLIVDDDEHDVALARHFLQRAHIPNPLVHIGTAEAAIAHLAACIEGVDTMPMLVFVDLKMPGMDGFAVLDWMRRQPALKRMLTVVLSSSTNPCDVARAVALGAMAFLSKHPQVAEIRSVFQLAASIRAVEELDRIINLTGIDRFDEVRAARYLAGQAGRSGRTVIWA